MARDVKIIKQRKFKKKMKKDSWKNVVLVLAIIVAVLFIFYNIGEFLKMREVRQASVAACEGLVVGDNCEFVLREDIVQGSCLKNRLGAVVCRPFGPHKP